MKNIDVNLSDYMHQWGARSVPFIERKGQDLFETDQGAKALELLQQSAALRSVMLLSGDNGTGKSTLAAHWIRGLDPRAYLPLVITHSSLSASGVLSCLLSKLGEQPALQRAVCLKRMEDALCRLGAVTPVILLDEAQNYAPSALEEIRLLLGLNLPDQPAFCLILIGDSYLLDTLRLQSRRALFSRIAVSYQLEPLPRDQIDAYLQHGLSIAGLDRPCFEPAAIEMIAAAAEGIPRTINLLARTAWIEASRLKHNTIETGHVQSALELIPMARMKIGR
jgi:type II secretory pathway predicted ATPase ExeA